MKKLFALMYHDVFNQSVNESGFQEIGAIKYKISQQSFEDQIKTIDSYCNKEFINKDNIYFTFDDGGRSFLTIIAPLLESYGYKGYFFITTKLINTLGFLTMDDIIELDQRGHTIGTHSHSHPINISALSYRQIELEWVESLSILTDILKKPIKYAAIPGGFFSSDSRNILFSNEVNIIFTSNPTTKVKILDSKMIIGRYSVTQGMSAKEVTDIIKPFSLVRIKQFLKWNTLKILKLILGRFYIYLRNNLLH